MDSKRLHIEWCCWERSWLTHDLDPFGGRLIQYSSREDATSKPLSSNFFQVFKGKLLRNYSRRVQILMISVSRSIGCHVAEPAVSMSLEAV
eukprot:4619716-Amphidinium_carterae.1